MDAVVDPEVPVIVRVVCDNDAVPAPGVRVSVVLPDVATVAGENDAVTPVGNPLTENDTVPVNPPAGATVTLSVAERPPKQREKMHIGGVTVTVDTLAESEIVPGFAVTVKLWVTLVAAE